MMGPNFQGKKMQDRKIRDQFHVVILFLTQKNVLCIDYFVTAVVTSAFD